MKRLIKRILREEIEKSDKHYRILDKISEYVHLPYFKSMEGLTIDDKDDQLYIMRNILGNDIYIRGDLIRDKNGNRIYYENSDGYWRKDEYDDKGNVIYEEHSSGEWEKKEYDDKGYQIYWENYQGKWEKNEYDEDGEEIYFENSNGNIWDNR